MVEIELKNGSDLRLASSSLTISVERRGSDVVTQQRHAARPFSFAASGAILSGSFGDDFSFKLGKHKSTLSTSRPIEEDVLNCW